MTGLRTCARFRAAIGLIAAYAIALQTLFAAFAPLPAHSQVSVAGWSVLCFGSGNAAPADGDPAAPASGKFHCVLCGSALAAAAVLPEPAAAPAPGSFVSIAAYRLVADAAPAPYLVRAGHARAPPLTA
jgi:hypothetical protein